jgi:hypothetical protein
VEASGSQVKESRWGRPAPRPKVYLGHYSSGAFPGPSGLPSDPWPWPGHPETVKMGPRQGHFHTSSQRSLLNLMTIKLAVERPDDLLRRI